MRLQWQPPGHVDHELIWGSIALLVLVALALQPLDRIMGLTGYRCPFRAITGLPCPGCGGTGALVAMSSLQFKRGFAHNPLVAAGWCCAVLYAPYALFVSLSRSRRLRVTDISARQRRMVAALVALAVLGNWVWVIVSCRQS